jgi:hypothetical protein
MTTVNGRTYRRVELDDHTQDEERNPIDRLMRGLPTPLREARTLVRTRNGNLVQAVAR